MDGVVDPSSAPTPESRERLLTLVMSHRLSKAIYVVTRLGIPDLLADGPRETDELAHATGSHPPSLHRVLLALAGVGVLEKVGSRRFALTSVGAGLRTGVPGSLRPGVLLSLDESLWRPWGHLLHTVRTGETAFHHAHGVGLFDYLDGHPEVARVVGDVGVLHTLDEVRGGLGDDVLTGAVVGAHVAVGRGSRGHSGGLLRQAHVEDSAGDRPSWRGVTEAHWVWRPTLAPRIHGFAAVSGRRAQG
jgi:hypothetical protein